MLRPAPRKRLAALIKKKEKVKPKKAVVTPPAEEIIG